MKRQLMGFFFLLALPLAALPPNSDHMIRSLVADGTVLGVLLDGLMSRVDDGFESAFDSIIIEGVPLDENLKRQCNNYSRSGAALKINVVKQNRKHIYFLSTPGKADELKVCQ